MLHMIFIALVSYSKIICICSKPKCYEYQKECKSKNYLDPKSPNFYDEILKIKKNVKDLKFYFINKGQSIDINIDLRIFNSYNLTFYSTQDRVYINFMYVSNEDYSETKLNFDTYNTYLREINFIPINNNLNEKENVLKIGTIDAPEIKKTNFIKINDLKTKLVISHLNILATSFSNVSSVVKSKPGLTGIKIRDEDIVEAHFSHNNLNIKINGEEINYVSIEKDSYLFKGDTNGWDPDEYNSTLKLIFDDDFTNVEKQLVTFTNCINVDITGKFSPPSATNPIKSIKGVRNLHIPEGDFPFNIFSDNLYLKIIGNTTIYGIIDAYDGPEYTSEMMYIGTDLKIPINVNFKDEVDAIITIQSPYLNLNIDKLTANSTITDADVFPVGFCFNENRTSKVYIKEISFQYSMKITVDNFQCYPTISQVYSNEELNNFSFLKDGFCFLDIPANAVENYKFSVDVNKQSPSQILGIPGFTKTSVCMGITAERGERTRFFSKIVKSAYLAPAYICISDQYDCDTPSGMTDDPFTKVDPDDIIEGDLSHFIGTGFKNIIISAAQEGQDINLDFDKLEGSGYNFTLIGKVRWGSMTQFNIKSTENKVDSLAVRDNKFTKDTNFNIPFITFSNVAFDKSKKYQFSEASHVTADPETLTSLSAVFNKEIITKLTMNHDYTKFVDDDNKKYVVTENIKILNDGIKTCQIGKDRKTVEYCSTINSNIAKELVINVGYPLDFTIIAFPASFKPFLLQVRPVKGNNYKRFLMSLDGSGWTTKLENKIKVEFGSTELEIRVTKPCQSDNLEFVGTGSKIFSLDYDDHVDYCVYTNGSHPTCFTDDNTSKIIMLANDDQLFDELKNIDDSKYSINIDIDSAINATSIPLSFLDKRKTKFQTTKNSATFSKVEFVNDNVDSSIDPVYSYTILSNINASYPNQSDVTLKFGQLVIEGGFEVSDNFKEHVSLEVSQLVSAFEDLQKFKHVRVNDQITLSGSVPIEGRNVSVDFEPDEDANDLISEITCDSRIIVSSEEIKIGLFSFHITHSKNYDAYFKVKGNCNITVESQTADHSAFPKFVIDTGIYECSIRFEGGFPVISSEEESLVLILGSNKATVDSHVTGYLPLSIHNLTQVDIITHTKSLSIHGPIDANFEKYHEEAPPIKLYNGINERATVEIINHINIVNVNPKISDVALIGLFSSNIDLRINNLTKLLNNKLITIQFINTISIDGCSKMIFNEDLPDYIEFSNKTYLISEMYGDIDNEDDFIFIKKPEVIIEAKPQDIGLTFFVMEYILLESSEKRIHGFFPAANCLGINVTKLSNENYGACIYAELRPSQIPYIIDFVTGSPEIPTELLINENNINLLRNLSQILPKSYDGIVFNLHTNMNKDEPLDLGLITPSNNKVKLIMRSINKVYEAHTTAPSDKDLSVSYQLLKLSLKTKSNQQNLEAEFLNFTDCTFLNPGDFRITSASVKSLCLDVDSLNGLIQGGSLESFGNSMRVNSANVIVFTSDGWEFREDRSKPTSPIRSSDFTNVSFETRMLCSLIISDESMTSIHGFDFNSYAQDDGISYFELSRHWGRIKELNGFKIKVNSVDRISVDTASYPIPAGMFDESSSLISYTFKSDEHGSFDSITIDDGKVYHDEKFSVDFQFLDEEHQIIRGKSATFTGNNEFVFANDVGGIEFTKVNVLENSTALFSNLRIIDYIEAKKGSTVTSSFNFGINSKAVMHWTLDNPSLLNHTRFAVGFPRELEIVYDDSDIDKEKFRSQMIHSSGIVLMMGNFDCISFKSVAVFGGDFPTFGYNNEYLSVLCDTSSEGQVLVLKGVKEVPDDDNSDKASRNGSISVGGIAGIVIACVVVAVVVVSLSIYLTQKKKIDRLKKEIPEDRPTL